MLGSPWIDKSILILTRNCKIRKTYIEGKTDYIEREPDSFLCEFRGKLICVCCRVGWMVKAAYAIFRGAFRSYA